MTDRRSRSKRGEGELLRAEILDAAEAILNETGSADKVTTRAVAQRVGCSSPSIYLHFPDRARLLFEMCQRQFGKLAVRLRAAADAEPDPIERLMEIGRTYCRFALENPQQYRTMMMDVIAGVAYESSLNNMQVAVGFDVLFEAVVDGIEAGALAAPDPLRAAFNTWAVAHGVVSLMIAKPNTEWGDNEALCESALRQGIEGLRARAAPPSRARSARPVAAKEGTAKKSALPKASAAR
jgi:AcrR family transcriptional regulator